MRGGQECCQGLLDHTGVKSRAQDDRGLPATNAVTHVKQYGLTNTDVTTCDMTQDHTTSRPMPHYLVTYSNTHSRKTKPTTHAPHGPHAAKCPHPTEPARQPWDWRGTAGRRTSSATGKRTERPYASTRPRPRPWYQPTASATTTCRRAIPWTQHQLTSEQGRPRAQLTTGTHPQHHSPSPRKANDRKARRQGEVGLAQRPGRA